MSFFKSSPSSGSSLAHTRALAAKKTIRAKIVEAIKDLQSDQALQDEVVESTGASNALCAALEAMFLHGTKYSFLIKLNTSLTSSSSKLPDTNFWLYVMVYTHRDTLARLEALSQISTDVGRCRCWLRLALNEGVLGSYLEAMLKDSSTARSHYERTAFMRDTECLDIVSKYMLGVEGYKFNLALNSSILNRWQTPPLVYAGIWIPDNVVEPPPAEAFDVVQQLEEQERQSTSNATTLANLASVQQTFAHDSIFTRGLINEDYAIHMILHSKTDSPSASSIVTSTTNSSSAVGSPPPAASGMRSLDVERKRKKKRKNKRVGKRTVEVQDDEIKCVDIVVPDVCSVCDEVAGENVHEVEEPVQDESTMPTQAAAAVADDEDKAAASNLASSSQLDSSFSAEESIYSRAIDPSSQQQQQQQQHVSKGDMSDAVEQLIDDLANLECKSRPSTPSAETTTAVVHSGTSKPEEISAPSLLVTAARKVATEALDLALPYLSGFIHSWNPFGSGRYFDTPPVIDANCVSSLGFSLQPDISIGTLNVDDSQRMIVLFDKVAQEPGLDLQNYECNDCSKAIGTIFGPVKVCSYTKQYYCEECHLDETAVIPVKVVYNWDFRRFRVSRKAKIFLDTINMEPIIDAKTFNAALFEFAPDLDEVFSLRKKLSYVSAYLATCRDVETNKRFVQMLWPREYLYSAQVGKYSIRDFEDIKNGQLLVLLRRALRFGEDHIMSGDCLLCAGKGFICEVCRDERPIYPFQLESICQCQKCFTVFHLMCSVQLKSCTKCDRREARNLDWHVRNSRMQRELPLGTS